MRPLCYTMLLILLHQSLQAQNCTGGLGDPMVEVTFGSGTGPGPSLGAGITTMQYVSSQCPIDGEYTLTNFTSGCFGTWHTIAQDHTGDPNGYFMLINASYQPSDFYVQTVTGLCAGTTYQFAVWAVNMMSGRDGIPPNITFSIERPDGTVLSSVQTGDIPRINPLTWTQYSTFFTTPTGISTVVLRMTNHSPGGSGNDLAIDDITFRPAGPQVSLTMNGIPDNTISFCAGTVQTQQLSATVEDCYNNPVYQWQEDKGQGWTNIPGAISPNYSTRPVNPGSYSYRLRVSEIENINTPSCGVSSPPATIVVLPILTPGISISTPTSAVCINTPTTFTASPENGGSAPLYEWLVNGVPVAGSPGSVPTFTSSTLRDGDIVCTRLISSERCVSLRNPLSNSITLSVTDNPVTSVQLTASNNPICSGNNVTFNAIPFNGGTNPTYEWKIDDQLVGNNAARFSSPTLKHDDEVTVTMTSSELCALPVPSNTISMTVHPTPVISLTPDTMIVGNTSFRLNPEVTGTITTWRWTPALSLDDPHTPFPLASPRVKTIYQLYVETAFGCNATAQETVFVYYGLSLPNAFTPNGDGKNDLFRVPVSIPVKIFRFSIFNRWGGLVFSTEDSAQGWNGTTKGILLPAGTYVWVIEFDDPILRKKAMKKGTVALIR